jgi:hypothetical protein
MMTQSRSKTTPLFQTSLRDWQANWKARQAARAEEALPAPSAPTRVKKFIAYKKRKQKLVAAAQG